MKIRFFGKGNGLCEIGKPARGRPDALPSAERRAVTLRSIFDPNGVTPFGSIRARVDLRGIWRLAR